MELTEGLRDLKEVWIQNHAELENLSIDYRRLKDLWKKQDSILQRVMKSSLGVLQEKEALEQSLEKKCRELREMKHDLSLMMWYFDRFGEKYTRDADNGPKCM
jgi:hypothetical protein